MMSKPMRTGNRCAVYLRVSTEEQTAANQLPELRRLAKARGWKIVHVYEETASAAKDRPVYRTMMEDAHAGGFDKLLVWSLDRLGRSLIGNTEAVLKLDRLGVVLVCAKESWMEMDGPVRELLVAIFSWIAEQERNRIRERTKAGMARAKAEGRHIGRPRAAITMSVVRAFIEDGDNLPTIAKKLRVSVDSLRRAVAREDARAVTP